MAHKLYRDSNVSLKGDIGLVFTKLHVITFLQYLLQTQGCLRQLGRHSLLDIIYYDNTFYCI